MPNYCCVPMCTSGYVRKGTVPEKVALFSTKDKKMQKLWMKYRGDRTHIGHCSKLDSDLKNSKISFKNLIFKFYVSFNAFFMCINFHAFIYIILCVMIQNKKHTQNLQIFSPLLLLLLKNKQFFD
jgi:hypothetical protein